MKMWEKEMVADAKIILLNCTDFEGWYKNYPGGPKVFNLPTSFFEQTILSFPFLRWPHREDKLEHFVQKILGNTMILTKVN